MASTRKARFLALSLMAVFLYGAARGAAAADTAAVEALLQVVPDNVLLVKVINRLDKLDQQVARLGQTLKTPLPGPVAVAQQTFGFNEGVDLTRSAGAALLSSVDRNGIPTLAVFIPVTDYQKFLAQLQPDDAKATVTTVQAGDVTMSAGKKGSFAVLCAEGNETQLRSLLAAQTSVSEKLKPLVDYLAEQDIGAVATTTGVQLGVNAVRVGLRQVKQQFANLGEEQHGKEMVAIFDVYDGMLASIENGVGQFGLGVRIDDAGGVHVTTRTLFASGSSLASAARDLPSLGAAPLSKVPAGSFVVAMDGVMPKGLTQGAVKMSVRMLKTMAQQGGSPLTDEQLTKLQEAASRSMEGVQSMAFRWGVGKPGASIYDGLMGLVRTDDARKYIENYEQSMAAMNELFKNANNPLLQGYELAKTELDGAPVLELTINMSAMLGSLPDADARQKMQALFGEGGKAKAYVMAADDKTVVMAYSSKDRLKEALETYRNRDSQGLANDAQVAKTQGLLLKDAQWVLYWSPQGTVDFTRQVMMNVVGGGNAPFTIPEFPASPPLGFAAKVAEGALQTDMVLPAETLGGIADYVRGIMGR